MPPSNKPVATQSELKWREVVCRYIESVCFTHADEHHRVIHDARLSFRRVKGFAIHFVFATKEELEGWRRRKLPLELESKAAGMETPTMGLNFEFGH